MQPYFIPYLGYFQLINSADLFLSYGKVSFRKKSWIQRNRLINKSNGTLYYEGIPLLNQSSNMLIDEIRINNMKNWQRSALKRIESNYSNACYYDETLPLLKNIYKPSTSLYDFITNSIQEITTHIGIDTPIISSSRGVYDDIEKNLQKRCTELDRKTVRVIELSKRHHCNEYINPIGGLDLYDKHTFNKQGIAINFLKSHPVEYQQFNFSFRPYLSVLDTLFHCGQEATHKQLNNFEIL